MLVAGPLLFNLKGELNKSVYIKQEVACSEQEV